jgi:cyclopropane fatty-acyl-phospholipid synthase-like methyltransferase
MSKHTDILAGVTDYYDEKITKHGVTPLGVDWNSTESQALRFEQLISFCTVGAKFSLLDYGCGYGALYEYLSKRNLQCTYTGFDISTAMIEKANEVHAKSANASFVTRSNALKPQDFVVASGIFNVKQETSDEKWTQYMKDTVIALNSLSVKGFSFNVLTSYSDADKKKAYLHYADPLFWFDYCKKSFSKSVALFHDYGLYEFTIRVRK